jgi:hypothetical protein
MNKGSLAITLLFTVLAPISASSAEHLHALIACDTFSNLRAEVNNNKVNLLKTLETIADQTGMSLHVTVLTGSNLTDKAIFAWADQVRQSPGGVALFSYSGHGFRTEATTEALPLLFFTRNTHAFRTDLLYHQLESAGPRLTVLLLDCCNGPRGPRMPRGRPKSPMVQNLPGMKRLFLETKGNVVFMGAAPGGISWYNFGRGGIFTSMFIRSLLEETQRPDASWQQLFNRTYQYCRPQQQPFSLLNISPTEAGYGAHDSFQ